MHVVLERPDLPALAVVGDVDLEAAVDEVIELLGGARAVALAVTRHPHHPAGRQDMRPAATGQRHLASDLLAVDVHLVGLVDEDDAAVVLFETLMVSRAPPERHGVLRLDDAVVLLYRHQVTDHVGRGEQRPVDNDKPKVLVHLPGDVLPGVDDRGGLAATGRRAQIGALAGLVDGGRQLEECVKLHLWWSPWGYLLKCGGQRGCI